MLGVYINSGRLIVLLNVPMRILILHEDQINASHFLISELFRSETGTNIKHTSQADGVLEDTYQEIFIVK